MFILRIKIGDKAGKYAGNKRYVSYQPVGCVTHDDINKARIFKSKNGIENFFGIRFKSVDDYNLYLAELQRYANEHVITPGRIPQDVIKRIRSRYTYILENVYDIIPVEIKIKQQ